LVFDSENKPATAGEGASYTREGYEALLNRLRDISLRKPKSSAAPRGQAMPDVVQLDADYMAAAKRKDTTAVRQAADRAAVAAGYKPERYFHYGSATTELTVPSPYGGKHYVWLTKDKKYAKKIGTYLHSWKPKTMQMTEAYLRAENTLDATALGTKPYGSKELLAFFERNGVQGLREVDIDSGQINEGNPFYAVLARDNGRVKMAMRRAGYDSAKMIEDFKGSEAETTAVFSSSQIKSAAPITRDNAGNIIPPSKRFDASNVDMRYGIAGAGLLGAASMATEEQ